MFHQLWLGRSEQDKGTLVREPNTLVESIQSAIVYLRGFDSEPEMSARRAIHNSRLDENDSSHSLVASGARVGVSIFWKVLFLKLGQGHACVLCLFQLFMLSLER